MDYQQKDKRKKKDKAREKHERFGSFSAKHVRLAEALASGTKPVVPMPEAPKDTKGKGKGKFFPAFFPPTREKIDGWRQPQLDQPEQRS